MRALGGRQCRLKEHDISYLAAPGLASFGVISHAGGHISPLGGREGREFARCGEEEPRTVQVVHVLIGCFRSFNLFISELRRDACLGNLPPGCCARTSDQRLL